MSGPRNEPLIAVVDVDGTLIDSNYHHALAWYRAFRSLGEPVPAWRLHRLIGMGGDQVVAAIGGQELEDRLGDRLRARHGEEFEPMVAEMEPLPGARDMLVAIRDRGHRLVLASSGHADQVQGYLDLLDVQDLVEAWTTSEDVSASKPHPDLLQAAIGKIGVADGTSSVMIGDSIFDVQAASRAGFPALVVRSGGFGDDELRAAGALDIFDTPGDLAAALDDTPLA